MVQAVTRTSKLHPTLVPFVRRRLAAETSNGGTIPGKIQLSVLRLAEDWLELHPACAVKTTDHDAPSRIRSSRDQFVRSEFCHTSHQQIAAPNLAVVPHNSWSLPEHIEPVVP